MRHKSSSSAGAVYLDKNARLAALREMAHRAAERLPAIRRIILFGSLASGIPTPRSDADLLIEVSQSPHQRPRDRTPEILKAFRPLPCPVDAFIYTSEELETVRQQGSSLVSTALREGIDLL